MTSKSNPGPRSQEKAVEKVIATSHEAETEQDVVSPAAPPKRWTADEAAAEIGRLTPNTIVTGNRVLLIVPGPNGLEQHFTAQVEESLREF